jgi:hypothetical protein
MNTYKVNITGTYHVQVNIDATSSREAEEKAAELDVTAIEHELFWNHGLSKRDILSIAADATPVDTGRYIVQPKGELYHLYFASKAALLQHLDERQRELYCNSVKYDELYEFFRARNYFRAL